MLGGQASAALIPPWEHPLVLAIAGAELAGCVAIALRARWRAGYALVFASLFAATVVHAMLGQAPPPAFAIDAACVVVLAVDARAREEAADAR